MEPFTALALSSLALLVAYFLLSYWKTCAHWKTRCIPHRRPFPLVGNFLDVILMRKSSAEWLKELYDSFSSPYFGVHIFGKPFLVLRSPELVKRVLVGDFDAFSDRTVAESNYDAVISNWLFFQKMPKWKRLRSELSSTFSTGKLRGMMGNLTELGKEMTGFIEEGEVETKDLGSRFATELTMKTFFGVKAHSFGKKESTIHNLVFDIMDTGFRNVFCHTCYFFVHSLVNPLRLLFINRKSRDYLVNVIWDVLNVRKGTGVKHHDLIDNLLEVLKKEEFCKEIQFENEAVAGPAINFLVAGHDTISTSVSFTLYELALQEDVKRKMVDEMFSCIKKHNGITYEAIQEMTYGKMCINETLRKYPTLPFLNRECNRTYTLPETNVVLQKGSGVLISLMGLHYDPKYFPEPEKYIPERFEGKVNDGGLYYLPFGEGPRSCMGKRFGLLSTQVALVHTLTKFDVRVCPRTPSPLEFDPKCVLLTSKTGVTLKFEALKNPKF